MLVTNCNGSTEKEVKLSVRLEEDDAKAVKPERIDLEPVPMKEFGHYVAQCHSNSNEIFLHQYLVCLLLCFMQ